MLNVAAKEGGFGEVKEVKGSPIPEEQVLQNIRDSKAFDFPIVRKRPEVEGSMIFVAGGPTLLDYLPEIRQRSLDGDYIVTSNNTHDFLVDNGIIPNACFIFDPKEKVKDYVKKHQKETTYYLATCCNRLTVQSFVDAGVSIEKVLIAYGLEGQADIKLQRELYPEVPGSSYLIGGTMTPLRAMPLAYMLGWRKAEYYGLDSCFGKTPPIIMEGEGGFTEIMLKTGMAYEDTETGKKYVVAEPESGGYFYAYKKKRAEDIIVAEVGSRRFLTSPGFAYQAKQLVMWVDRMEDKLEVKVHGDSLSSYLLGREEARRKQERELVGDRRWTDEYAAMQFKLHEGQKYGTAASKNRGGAGFDIVSRLVVAMKQRLGRPITLLDYGSGSGDLGRALQDTFNGIEVTNYDPFHPHWQDKPEPGVHDMLTCLDVMEHVEEPCVENTLRFMADRTRFGALFIISLQEAVKTLPDGRNAHITVKNATWWKNRLQRFFTVCEVSDHGHTAVFLCEAKRAAETLEAEKIAA